MNEWILIISMHVTNHKSPMDTIQFSTIDGFTSYEKCSNAGKKLAYRIILEAGKHKESEGIEGNSNYSSPSVFYECEKIDK